MKKPDKELVAAITNNQLSRAKAAIDAGANVNALSFWMNFSPLHYAAKSAHADIVKLLIDEGAEVNATKGTQLAPLHLAAEKGNTAAAQLLIDNGADVNTRDEHLRAPLHYAALGGHTNTARLLIEKGADVSARNDWQLTPLDRARTAKAPDMIALLEDAVRRPATNGKSDMIAMLDEAARQQGNHAERVIQGRDDQERAR